MEEQLPPLSQRGGHSMNTGRSTSTGSSTPQSMNSLSDSDAIVLAPALTRAWPEKEQISKLGQCSRTAKTSEKRCHSSSGMRSRLVTSTSAASAFSLKRDFLDETAAAALQARPHTRRNGQSGGCEVINDSGVNGPVASLLELMQRNRPVHRKRPVMSDGPSDKGEISPAFQLLFGGKAAATSEGAKMYTKTADDPDLRSLRHELNELRQSLRQSASVPTLMKAWTPHW